jgi:hypothetical protein
MCLKPASISGRVPGSVGLRENALSFVLSKPVSKSGTMVLPLQGLGGVEKEDGGWHPPSEPQGPHRAGANSKIETKYHQLQSSDRLDGSFFEFVGSFRLPSAPERRPPRLFPTDVGSRLCLDTRNGKDWPLIYVAATDTPLCYCARTGEAFLYHLEPHQRSSRPEVLDWAPPDWLLARG